MVIIGKEHLIFKNGTLLFIEKNHDQLKVNLNFLWTFIMQLDICLHRRVNSSSQVC